MKTLKRTAKKTLAIVLTFVLVLSLPLCINAATVKTAETGGVKTGSCGANVSYSFDTETGVLTISGTGNMANYRYGVSAPWYSDKETLTSVVISDGVTSIGNYAFYCCSSLTSIEIPSSVTIIGISAFDGCTGLTSIEIPSSVTSIDEFAFSFCAALTSIEISSRVVSIGDYAFGYCTGLTSIIISEGVTSIGNNAFTSCTGLTSINIPSSVTSIGFGVFDDCSSLISINVDEENKNYSSLDGVLYSYDKTSLIRCPEGKASIEIPLSVTSIGEGAFFSCTGLTSIEIPEGVTSIGDYAFKHCSGLTSIEIPEGVTSIGGAAFVSCSQLKSAYIYNKNAEFGYTMVENDVFADTPSDFTIYGYKNSTSQTYAEKNSHNFVALDGEESKADLILSYDNGQADGEFNYDSDYTVSFSELSAPQKDKSVFTGWYLDSECTIPAGSQVTVLKGEKKTLYAGWKEVGNAIEAEAEDRTGSTATTSEFDLFGAQFREQTSSYTTGLRFCTRVSKSLISEIEAKTGSPAESGYVLSAKDNVLSDTELEVGAVAANGKTVKENAAPIRYYDGKGYYVYTAVIVNIPDDMQSTDIVARPYIKYTDANGVLRYYYFTESGESNCGGGYYTSYTAVYNAYLAAQG